MKILSLNIKERSFVVECEDGKRLRTREQFDGLE